MREPSLAVYHRKTRANRAATLIAATRPAFLSASVLPVVVAVALAWRTAGTLSLPLAALALVNIALIHAGANVLNDYYDALSGGDERNERRLFPFSGGSRFIQNGVLTAEETRKFGLGLTAAGAALGLLAVWLTGPLLLLIGLAGGAIAIAYSAPPCLACRGLGDLAVATAFGLLPVAGATLMLTGAIPAEAWWAGAIVGCFVAAILWANGIPDIDADRAAGKWTLPARLGPRLAARLLPAWFALGFVLLALAPLPRATWAMALALALVPAALATRAMIAGRLDAALPLTIATHAAACLALAAGLALAL